MSYDVQSRPRFLERRSAFQGHAGNSVAVVDVVCGCMCRLKEVLGQVNWCWPTSAAPTAAAAAAAAAA